LKKHSEFYIMSEQHAEDIKPVLKWIIKDAPRKREREEAKAILREIQNISGGWKQIGLTRSELQLLETVHKAFPEGAPSETGKQLELFHTSPVDRPATIGQFPPHKMETK
jgi:hypothetical protein